MSTALVLRPYPPVRDTPRRWALELAAETLRLRHGLPGPGPKHQTTVKLTSVSVARKISADAVLAAIAERNAARARRDYAAADAIRAALLQKNVELQDSKTGTSWVYV